MIVGSLRDSTHPAVTAQPGLFTTTPPTVAQVGQRLWNHLQVHPAGTEVT